MEALKDRPPYVSFEQIAVEDRAATIAQGRAMVQDIDMAYITPAGSKDRIPRIVKEWFAHLEKEVADGRFPPAWLAAYKESYAAWKAGKEPPVHGISIRNWSLLSPAQAKTLSDLKILTIEDVAAMNEEAMARVGMGARSLKEQAAEYLKNTDKVSLVAKISALELERDALKGRNAELEAANAALQGQLAALMNVGGTPPMGASAQPGAISGIDLMG